MNPIKYIALCLGIVVLTSNAGCVENIIKQPEVSTKGITFEGTDNNGNIKMNIGIIINNSNPIGVHINEISFKIYHKTSNGELISIGKGSVKDISIKNGMNTVNIPITLSSDKLIEIASKSKTGKIRVLIEGNVNVDTIITNINIPIKFEDTLDLKEIGLFNKSEILSGFYNSSD